ncbi:MAG: hypothetical protein CME88_09250 [Hirschia sp.]|nr:hypothetical protein [Hirschia sp.]MBF18550.1 hypothetical protein [Hirschia sp.]|tara:strand:+ start:138 stop:797 length:660 start_codon:yes stop_codon:yes gene_type:complete
MQAALFALIAPLIMQMSAGDMLRLEDRERLADCIVKLEQDPVNAYEDGLTWQAEGNRPEARHCVALALIELGRPEEGAARLENLAMATDGGSREDRAHYFFQAGNAWIIARRPEAAQTALDEAVKLDPSDADKYLARARSTLLQERWHEAQTDLDKALEIRGDDVIAYQLRAETKLRQHDLSGAQDDVRMAMQLDPENVEVLVLRGRVREALRKTEGLD